MWLLVFQNIHQNILNVFEDTLLILVSKDLYKLQILKVKGKRQMLFSCHNSKKLCFTYYFFFAMLISPSNISGLKIKCFPSKKCDYPPNEITSLYLNYRDSLLRI